MNENKISLHEYTVEDINGDTYDLSQLKGKKVMVVNTASKCGLTPQYEALEALYKTYQSRGFTIVAFPSNNFMGQEPGSNESIATFCETRFQITFPLFAKIDVKGKNQHPLYAWLTSKENHPSFGGGVSWNFNKFLISPEGELINRFGSRIAPNQKQLIAAIEQALPNQIFE